MAESSEASTREPVAFDPATRRLTVGNRSTVVPDVDDRNEAMLRGYLAVVAQVRGTAVGSLTQVRQDDVAALAELLDLDDGDLEARFVRLLGMTPEMAADTRHRIARHRAILAAAGLTVGVLMSPSVASGSSQGPAASVAPVAVSVAASADGTVRAITRLTEQPEPTHVDEPVTTPTTTPSSDVEIGDALVIERGTPSTHPDVQIGDAETFER